MNLSYHPMTVGRHVGHAICMPRREQHRWTALHADSDAQGAMTDFDDEHAVVIGPEVGIDHALADMMRHGVRALIVVQEAQMIGLITAQDILGEKPLHYLTTACTHDSCLRKDVLVADIMTPVAALALIDIGVLQAARVGDLEQTFHAHDVTHLLVVQDAGASSCRLRGLVSRSRLARQLGHAVDAAGYLAPSQAAMQIAAS